MPVRDTFWNIPHWAEIGQYLLGFITILVFSYGVIRHVRRWREGAADRRTDRLGSRFAAVFTDAILQRRIVQDRYAGVMHLTIFWGMIALLVGTVLATVDWDVTHLFFGFQFLEGSVYVVYELILDILGILLLVGLGMAAYRRYFVKPERLKSKSRRKLEWDDAYAIFMLVLVAITGYLVEALRIAVVQPDWAAWSPIGNALAMPLMSTGLSTDTTFHFVLWVSHALVAFIFIASIPFTKLFHLVTTPLNIFFKSLQPPGKLAPAREHSDIGVEVWQNFTWKQILDFEACVRCGRCQDQCPSYASGLSLSPRDLMIKLDAHMWERQNGNSLHGDVFSEEALWSCTTCRACSQACPAFADHLGIIIDMRRHLVMEGRLDSELQEALANLGRYGNSFGQSPRKRAMWSRGLKPKLKDARKEPVDYLWFVGDYASYNPTLTTITQKTAEVFGAADLDYGILYDGEQNSGNDVRRVGEEGLFEMLVEKNMGTFEKSDFKQIITTDPHSYNTLKNEYPANGSGQPAIWHASEVLDQLISTGRLEIDNPLEYRVTYHDPCYLGRYNGIYDAPRRVIQALGCDLVEMPRTRDRALCCGAGGGRIWMSEGEVTERPSESRINEAAKLPGVDTLITTCPKDVTMFQDAVKTTGVEGEIVVRDLFDLVHEAIEG